MNHATRNVSTRNVLLLNIIQRRTFPRRFLAYPPVMRPRRYDIREDSEGWTVFDVFTGEAVAIHGVPQTGMDVQDADELAELLDHRALQGGPLWQ